MGILELALLALLVGCFIGAASLSVAEVSVIRLRRSEVLVDAQAGSVRSGQLLDLLDDLPVVLNTVLLLVLLLQVVAATISGFLADRWFGGLGVTVATFVITVVLFLYAEAIPKTRAVRSPQEMALRLTPLLRVLVVLLRPVVGTLVALADLQSPGTGATLGALNEDEIRALARESAAAGEIAAGDATLLERSFEFNDQCVGDVMVSREKIAAVAANQVVADVLTRAIMLGHRRLPVYRETLDEIIGVVRLRDLAEAARTTPSMAASSVATKVLRTTPETLISQLLAEMQATGRWLAIVVDAGGRVVGLATIEDLVAELVGEIADQTEPRR